MQKMLLTAATTTTCDATADGERTALQAQTESDFATSLIPLTDKQIVKQKKKKSQTALAAERTLTRLYSTKPLSESQSDSMFCLKLVVVVVVFL